MEASTGIDKGTRNSRETRPTCLAHNGPHIRQWGSKLTECLEAMASKRVELQGTTAQIPQLGRTQLTDYGVRKFDSPESWRLSSKEDTSTEAAFRIQGILCGFDLPPLSSKATYLEKSRYFLKQSVRLTGLSTDAFQDAASACEDIYTMMTMDFPPKSSHPWQSAVYEGHTAIDFNARYFTRRRDAPNESNLPFLEGIDPQGILEKLRKHDLIHGPDNQVEYIKLLENDRYAQFNPSKFQLGDIVEATVAFVLLPIKGDRFILVPQLKVLTWLYRLPALTNLRRREGLSCKSSGTLKRKRLYVTEDSDEEARQKMAKMQIDGEDGNIAKGNGGA